MLNLISFWSIFIDFEWILIEFHWFSLDFDGFSMIFDDFALICSDVRLIFNWFSMILGVTVAQWTCTSDMGFNSGQIFIHLGLRQKKVFGPQDSHPPPLWILGFTHTPCESWRPKFFQSFQNLSQLSKFHKNLSKNSFVIPQNILVYNFLNFFQPTGFTSPLVNPRIHIPPCESQDSHPPCES